MTMTLGQPLRRYREHAGYTQKDVARLMMVTPQAVSKWENDAGTPDISLLRPIAKLFGITHRHLAGRAYTRPRRHSALIKSHTSDDYVAEYDELRALCRENPDRPEILLRLLGCIAEWLSHARDALSRDQQTALVADAEDHASRFDDSEGHGRLAAVYLAIGMWDLAEREIAHLPNDRYTAARMRGNAAYLRHDYAESRAQFAQSAADTLLWLLWDLE